MYSLRASSKSFACSAETAELRHSIPLEKNLSEDILHREAQQADEEKNSRNNFLELFQVPAQKGLELFLTYRCLLGWPEIPCLHNASVFDSKDSVAPKTHFNHGASQHLRLSRCTEEFGCRPFPHKSHIHFRRRSLGGCGCPLLPRLCWWWC